MECTSAVASLNRKQIGKKIIQGYMKFDGFSSPHCILLGVIFYVQRIKYRHNTLFYVSLI